MRFKIKIKIQNGTQCSSRGFTLIELLIVIAIIGILSGVTLISTRSAVEKSKKAAATTSAASVLPELVTCQDDGGKATNSAPVSGRKVCCVTTACAAFVDGHSATWPDISKTGFVYASSSGDITENSYVYTLTKTVDSVVETITCNMATNGCS